MLQIPPNEKWPETVSGLVGISSLGVADQLSEMSHSGIDGEQALFFTYAVYRTPAGEARLGFDRTGTRSQAPFWWCAPGKEIDR